MFTSTPAGDVVEQRAKTTRSRVARRRAWRSLALGSFPTQINNRLFVTNSKCYCNEHSEILKQRSQPKNLQTASQARSISFDTERKKKREKEKAQNPNPLNDELEWKNPIRCKKKSEFRAVVLLFQCNYNCGLRGSQKFTVDKIAYLSYRDWTRWEQAKTACIASDGGMWIVDWLIDCCCLEPTHPSASTQEGFDNVVRPPNLLSSISAKIALSKWKNRSRIAGLSKIIELKSQIPPLQICRCFNSANLQL